MFKPNAPPHVPDSVFHLRGPAELQSGRPPCSGLLHAGGTVFVNQQFEVRMHFLVEIALDGAVARQVAEERRKEPHGWLL